MAKVTKKSKKEKRAGKRKRKRMPKNVNWILTCTLCDYPQSISGEGNYTCPCGAKYNVAMLPTGTGGWQLSIILMNEDEMLKRKET